MRQTRRSFLAVAGVVGAGGLAGCSVLILSDTSEATVGGSFDPERAFR